MEDNTINQNQEVIETTETNEEVVEKTFTQEEVNKLLQSESDKRVSSALATAKEKWMKELEAQKAEAEKLASMSQEERIKAEVAKEKELFESERAKFLKEKMEMQTIKELATEKLPVEFVNFVVADTAEEVKENIKLFKEAWSEAINNAVSERLAGKIPTDQNTASNIAVMSKEDFAKLPYKKRAELLEKDPDFLKKIK